MKRELNGVTLECMIGDIANQPDIVVVVNAANAELRIGGGVAGALHRKAGPGLEAECRPLAPIRPGQAVITAAHRLPNRHVIHCLGPVYGVDEPADALLASCYREALFLADQHGLESVAFPAISTGAFGYPLESAARVACEAIVGVVPRLTRVKQIRFVLLHESDVKIHERAFGKAIDVASASSNASSAD